MKKTPNRKLQIHRQTLRNLQRDQLRMAAGGTLAIKTITADLTCGPAPSEYQNSDCLCRR